MKFKVRLASVFIIFFIIAAAPCFGAQAAEKSAYGKDRRPYSCFMKRFMNFTGEDFQGQEGISQFLNAAAPDVETSKKINDYGKSIYEKYKKDIDELIKDFDKISAEKNPRPEESHLKSMRSHSPVINFNYTRSLARALIPAARYLASQKRHSDALKLATLVFRFGQLVQNGDGSAPLLITCMIGISVKNIAAENVIADFLLEGGFDAAFYDSYSASLLKMNDDELNIVEIINCERYSMINTLEYEVFIRQGNKTEFSQYADQIPDARLEEAKNYTTGLFNSFYDTVSIYLTQYSDKPYIVKDLMDKMFQEISERGRPSLWKALSPIKAVGDILLAIAMPNFSRSYEQLLRSRYYPFGAALLSKILAGIKSGAKIPQTIAEIEGMSKLKLPPDYFNDKDRALKYKNIDGNLTLYSIGIDLKDDGGDPKKDIILFRLPQNFK